MHTAIHISIWVIALIFTGIICLLKRYPDTLAGYNTMPPEKKKNVDLQGMVRYIFNGMLTVTWSMVLLAYLTGFLTGNESLVMWGLSAWLATGTIAVAILARKFDRNKKRKPINNQI